jgi:hypothetical protein
MEDLLLPFALRRSGQKAWASHPAPAPKTQPQSQLPSCIASTASTFEQHWLERTANELSHLERLNANRQSLLAPRAQKKSVGVLSSAGAALAASSSSSAAAAADSDSCSSSRSSDEAARPLVHASATGSQVWTQPLTLTDAYSLLTTYTRQAVRLMVGNTSTGVVKVCLLSQVSCVHFLISTLRLLVIWEISVCLM